MKKIAILLFLTQLAFSQKKQVDLLIHNAQVYTVDEKFSRANAFVVDKGIFVEVGDASDLTKKYLAKSTVDLHHKAVFPGFYDPHSHFLGLGQMLSQCDLVGAKSFKEILTRLQNFRKEHPTQAWLVGRGWDQNDWDVKVFPNKDDLDQIFPDVPVMLTRIDGHAMLVNSKVIQAAKISPSSKVSGGDVEVIDGQLTGILIDNAMGLVKRVMPKEDEKVKRQQILAAQAECLKNGLTTVSDAGINQEDIELMMKMQKEGSLKIRDYAMVSVGLRNVDYFTRRGIIKTDRMNVRSFKVYADGALGSRGAVLLKPYSDQSSNSGFLLTSKSEMDKYFAQIYKSNYQVNTHCIGDSANRLVLDLYGKYLKSKNNRRWRIEHCQVVNPSDVPKFGKYSVIPSIQATHATSDMYWAEARLGKERVRHAYPFEDLRKQNGMLANGSDFPVEFVNPLYGFHSAVARQDHANWPSGGFQMENALSKESALRAMTIWSAYANFEEKERGSIEKGKMADFVVLEDDIMTADMSKIRNVKVNATYIGGERVFSIK
ncbi:MAG TPA: amidohydrolase family protein [Leadbetterella sp.]|nr:amidohydrolase family protein [Leadbetterella sp.]